MIDLAAKYLEAVKSVFRKELPDCEVRVFGSRVTGSAKRYSDLDVALVADGKLDFAVLEKLKNIFSESDLPISVDIHDWKALSDSFKKSIGDRYEVLV